MHRENGRACRGIVYCGVLGQAKECRMVVDKGLKFSKAVPLKPVLLRVTGTSCQSFHKEKIRGFLILLISA